MGVDRPHGCAKLGSQGLESSHLSGFLAEWTEAIRRFDPLCGVRKAESADRQCGTLELMGEVANRPHLRLWFESYSPHAMEKLRRVLPKHCEEFALERRVACRLT
ncbi:MAG TPA: hypothetical protein VGG12_06910 [Methylovirgula sp.]|jgi:hypothetical protein